MIIHLCLPLIYLFGYSYFALVVDASFHTVENLIDTYPPFYYCVVLATLLVISAFTLVYYWSLESWEFHPFVKKVCTIFLLWVPNKHVTFLILLRNFSHLHVFSPTLESGIDNSVRISWMLMERPCFCQNHSLAFRRTSEASKIDWGNDFDKYSSFSIYEFSI